MTATPQNTVGASLLAMAVYQAPMIPDLAHQLDLNHSRVYTRTMLDTQCLCINLRRAARGVSRHYDGALDGFGINVAQYSLLCNLQRLNQPSISTLAEAMGLDRSTLGRNLRVLEGDGLVTLVEGEDMRNRIVMLTEAGAERLKAALPAWEAAQQRLVERLGAEKREILLKLLDELA